MKIERRSNSLELRAAGDGSRTLSGRIAQFNVLSDDLGGFVEVIRPGAFSDSLVTNPDVRALWNHSTDHVLGRTISGTLRLVEDNEALNFELDIPKTSTGNDLVELVTRGDVTGCSFGFTVDEERLNYRGEELPLRELLKVSLIEVSIVTFPAYAQADFDLVLRNVDKLRAGCQKSRDARRHLQEMDRELTRRKYAEIFS